LLIGNGILMAITREELRNLRIVGHRGWPVRFPDNVLAGIEAATTVADMVEVDIRTSIDDVLVLSHDPMLGNLPVATSTWRALSALDLGGGHAPVALDQLLARFPNFPFNLEVKNHPGEPGFDPEHRVALRTADLARPHDLLTCFFWPAMDAIRQPYPLVATGLLVDAGGSVEDAVDHALVGGHVAVIPQWELALESGPAVRTAVDSGLVVAVWTLNDPEQAIRLASLGVTAIITDDPGRMRRALQERS
jgi:glycerophosphoryl diester phosphodiesterase